MVSGGYLLGLGLGLGIFKYPTLTNDTEVNSCFSMYLNSEIIYTTKTIL